MRMKSKSRSYTQVLRNAVPVNSLTPLSLSSNNASSERPDVLGRPARGFRAPFPSSSWPGGGRPGPAPSSLPRRLALAHPAKQVVRNRYRRASVFVDPSRSRFFLSFNTPPPSSPQTCRSLSSSFHPATTPPRQRQQAISEHVLSTHRSRSFLFFFLYSSLSRSK